MDAVSGQSQTSQFKVFTTNNGKHTPELVAEMSLHTLLDKDSNPVKAAKIRQALVDLYAEAQRTIQVLFLMVSDEKGIDDRIAMKQAIIQILVRDFNTALDIERQMFKEI